MDIIAMQHSGLSVRRIAIKLGRHRNTAKKHIENKEFPHYPKHRGMGDAIKMLKCNGRKTVQYQFVVIQ